MKFQQWVNFYVLNTAQTKHTRTWTSKYKIPIRSFVSYRKKYSYSFIGYVRFIYDVSTVHSSYFYLGEPFIIFCWLSAYKKIHFVFIYRQCDGQHERYAGFVCWTNIVVSNVCFGLSSEYFFSHILILLHYYPYLSIQFEVQHGDL